MEVKKEVRIEVTGRVQGVLFRDNVKGFADEFELKGFVMNKEDGGVSILAQGSDKELEGFVDFVQKNPGFSKIDGLNYKRCKVGKEYPDFRIVRENNIFVDKAKSLIHLGRFLVGQEGTIVPRHIAIIPDGNRRWAKTKGLEGTFGHYRAGAYDNLEELFKEGKKLGVGHMSIWGFSTDNWKRSKLEQKEIFKLILSGVERFIKKAHKSKIRFRHFGRKDRLPKNLINALEKLEKETASYDGFNVNLCLDYGGRDELIRAVNKALENGKKISEKDFSGLLDSSGVPDVDMIIRTSGEKRLSGFMPFQGAYAELYFSYVHFPDFGVKELRKSVREFGRRQRRFGGN
jgi:undecaprenyl diphosphate synthase